MLLFDLFSKNRGVRGTISIMLALMLLPIFSLIALMIESARYRSAQEQLSELTYLGQLAIMADYMDYLSTNYDLYAFKGTDINGNDVLVDSFESYVKSAKSAGGIDTRKLNTLFGIKEDMCQIQYMYSIADPDVLEYQILQGGRYSMPADVLSKITLQALIEPFKKQIEKVEELLGKVQNVTNKIEKGTDLTAKATGVFVSASKLCEDLDYLEGKIDDYNTSFNTFQGYRSQLQSYYNSFMSNDNGATFEKMYNLSRTDSRSLEQKLQDADADKPNIEALSNALNAFSYGTPNTEITLSENQAKYLNAVKSGANYASGDKVNYSTVSNAIVNYGNECHLKYYTGSAVLNLNSSASYNSAKDAVNGINIDSYKSWCSTFDAFEKSEANKALVDLNDEAKALKLRYDNYMNSLDAFLNSYKDLTQSLGELQQTIESEIDRKTIEELNKSNAEMHETLKYGSADPADKVEHYNKYDDAKSIKNYAKSGETIITKFTTKVTSAKITQWKNDFDNRVDTLGTSTFTTNGNASTILESLRDFVNSDYSQYDFGDILRKFDIYEACSKRQPISNEQYGQVMSLCMIICRDSEEDNKDENGIYKSISNEILDKLYDPLSNFSDSSILLDDSKDYYFSRPTICALTAFLGCTSVADTETKDLFSFVSMIADALSMFLPADPRLNTHIDNVSILPSRQSFNEMGIPSTADVLNQQIKSRNFKENTVGDLNTSVESRYYINDLSVESDSGLFGDKNPGESISSLVSGTGQIISSIKNFVSSYSSLNFVKLFKAVINLIEGLAKFVKGFLGYVGDIVTYVKALVENPVGVLEYFINQLYISHYAVEHFKSRQTATDKNNYNLDANFNITDVSCNMGKSCSTTSKKYTAELEYFLIGDPCEITNQEYAYYAIFFFRFALNLIPAFTDKKVMQIAQAIPYVGMIIVPLFASYAESKLDMFIMLGGHDVNFVKTKMQMFQAKTYSTIIEIMEGHASDLAWKMKPDSGGIMKQREYYTRDFKSKVEGTLNETVYKPAEKGKSPFAFNYNDYIVIISLMYSKKQKVQRIADLIQMNVRENKDQNFKLSDYYTYIGADVRAEFKPVMPIMSGQSFDALELDTVQYSGY